MLKVTKACKFWVKNCKIRFSARVTNPGFFFAPTVCWALPPAGFRRCVSQFSLRKICENLRNLRETNRRQKNAPPCFTFRPLHYLCAAQIHPLKDFR